MYEVEKLNSKFSDYYINVAGNDGSTYHGGNQGWWQDKVTTGDDVGHRRRLKEDKYYRLWKIGCGIIAMSDAELYLTLQNSGYSLSVSSTFDENTRQTGWCRIDAYRDYIERLYHTKYTITGSFVNTMVGLYPWKMTGGFRNFLRANHSSRTNVKWARYGKVAGITRKQKILNEIKRMLNADLPVVFSYHSFAKKSIILYDSIQEAKDNVSQRDNPANADSHYMTIIGLYKCPDERTQNYKYILQVVSWGRVYYIDYDQYAKKLDYFSNILSVY
ncbi:MAG: hypothetical protein HDR18_12225 [Lachnospiraceae bacterium]|nr:hypothetical protein [Lachnospiraceae bacterium]